MTSSTDGEPGLVITNLRGMNPLAHAINQCLHTSCRLNLELPCLVSDARLGEQGSDLWPVRDAHLAYHHAFVAISDRIDNPSLTASSTFSWRALLCLI